MCARCSCRLMRGCATSDWRSHDIVTRNQDGNSTTCPTYNAVWPPSYLSAAITGPGYFSLVVEGYGAEVGPYAFTWSLSVTGGTLQSGVTPSPSGTPSPLPASASRTASPSSSASWTPTRSGSASPAPSPVGVGACACGYYGVGCASYQATSYLDATAGGGLERGSTQSIVNW